MFERKYSYHVPEPLDLAKMREAAALFIGSHDFKGFSSDKRPKKSTIKTIYAIDIEDSGGMVEIHYHGNSFLYNMARIITGTLIDAGLRKPMLSAVKEALESGLRASAGFTAPPQGLFLVEVAY